MHLHFSFDHKKPQPTTQFSIDHQSTSTSGVLTGAVITSQNRWLKLPQF